MAYPTDPSQVGLTTPKSELSFFDTASSRTLQTSDASYENLIFRGPTLIFQANNLTFTNCWFYATSGFWLVYGAGNPQNIRFINCEFGLSSSDSTIYDPNGFTGTCSDKGLGFMQWKMYNCYSHHQSDGHYLGDGSEIDHCYFDDYVITGDGSVHVDVLQFGGGQSNVSVRRSWLNLSIASDNVIEPTTGGENSAVFIQSMQGPISNVEFVDNYMDGAGWFTFATSIPNYSISGLRLVGNRFGRSFRQPGGGPVLIDEPTDDITRYDNRYADTLELIPGDSPAPSPAGGTMISSDRYTRSQESAVTSGNSIFGPTVTASSSANTMGSWTQVVATTEFDAYLIAVSSRDMTSNGVDTSALLDVGVDPAGGSSYSVVVPYLPVGHSNTDDGRTVVLPVFIPKGSSVAVRMQSVSGSLAGRVGVRLYGGQHANMPRPHRSVLTAYGVTAASSSGVSPASPAATNTKGAWTLVGTASRSHRGLVLAFQGANNALDAFDGLADVGIDPAGGSSYTTVMSNVFVRGVATERVFSIDPLSCIVSFPVPSGATIAVRGQSTNASGLSTLDVVVYGF